MYACLSVCLYVCMYVSGVTESLLLLVGGGGARERHRNDSFPITFIVHNQKSKGRANVGDHDVNRGPWPPGPQ